MNVGDYSLEAKEVFRTFSFELESQISPDKPSDQLARAVVEDRNREDGRARELAEWRKYFGPWPVSE